MNLELENWKIKESCMRYNYKKMNYILTSSTMQYFLHFVLLSGAFFYHIFVWQPFRLFSDVISELPHRCVWAEAPVSGRREYFAQNAEENMFEVFPPCIMCIIFSPAGQVCGCESSSDHLISPEQCSGQCRGQAENWKYLHKNLSTNLLWLLYLLSHCVICELPLPCVYKFIYNS